MTDAVMTAFLIQCYMVADGTEKALKPYMKSVKGWLSMSLGFANKTVDEFPDLKETWAGVKNQDKFREHESERSVPLTDGDLIKIEVMPLYDGQFWDIQAVGLRIYHEFSCASALRSCNKFYVLRKEVVRKTGELASVDANRPVIHVFLSFRLFGHSLHVFYFSDSRRHRLIFTKYTDFTDCM